MDKQMLSGDEIILSSIRISDIESIIDSSVRRAVSALQPRSEEEIPISVREAAALLGIALPTLYSKISKREFSSFKRGKKVYLLKSELLNYLKSGKRKSREEIVKAA